MRYTESFVDRYVRAASARRSVACVGLDPTPQHVPPGLDMQEYLEQVVELAAGRVPVVKPQSAFYEDMDGGMELLADVVELAQCRGLLTILDAKRQDIGNTMQHYGHWILSAYDFDAVTVNTYLGPTWMPNEKEDNWLGFFEAGKMAIMMVMTSNPEATWLQKQRLANGQMVYVYVAQEAAKMDRQIAQDTNGVGAIGCVVGATYPEEAVTCRLLAPDNFFLIPGFGVQGGGAAGAVAGFPTDGRLLGTVNSSRGITMAWQDENGDPKQGDPMEHVEAAIDGMNININSALEALLGFDPYALW